MSEFERAAERDGTTGNLGSELWSFLRSSRKWWLAPILIVLLAFGLLLILSTTAAAPFIYTLF
jgi:hypothetical protein